MAEGYQEEKRACPLQMSALPYSYHGVKMLKFPICAYFLTDTHKCYQIYIMLNLA